MTMLLDLAAWVCIVVGGFLCVVGAVGLLRFPDFFSRMHAASVTDTGGLGLIIIGLILHIGVGQVALKLFLILLFLLFTSPVATHALAKAALHGRVQPWTRKEDEKPSKP